MMKKILHSVLMSGLVLATGIPSVQAAEIFDFGANWKYTKGTQEASTPVDAWRQVGFDDAAWLDGTAPFYYENSSGYTGNTLLNDMFGGYSCIFMRHTFTVTNPTNISSIILNLQSDDGCIVWINGVEVGSLGRPSDPITFQSTAANVSGEPKSGLQNVLDVSFLVPGDNVIAVQAVNGSLGGSSDFFIDVSMNTTEPDPIPPTVVSFDPPTGTISELSQVMVTFNEPVTGVEAGDLLVNGVPASSIIGADEAYTFFFPQPAFGAVTVGFAASHGIEDMGIPPNPFDETDPSASVTYNLVDLTPPIVASINPSAGSVVLDLNQILIDFNESVTGVDASDLEINGQPATNLTVFTPSQYAFAFPEPPTGAVAVAWSAAHGIEDLAAIPNPFAGGAWTYTLDPNAVASELFITEFMAINDGVIMDEDGDTPDWIEIHNAGVVTADLDGWYLTDNANNLDKWKFPETNLVAGGYMIIFASEKNRDTPGAPLHTNFRLSGGGEYLALVQPDGQTIATEFSPTYPPQVPNVSYGLPVALATDSVLSEGDTAQTLVPSDGSLGLDWTIQNFDDSSWSSGPSGVGFELDTVTVPNLSSAIQTDLQSDMYLVNSASYIRFPFVINDPSKLDVLTLRMKYDDGYIGFINGNEVLRRNASTATSQQLADSVQEFGGTQGLNNWTYGYRNRTTDSGSDTNYNPVTEFIPFVGGEGMGPWNAVSQQWSGTGWDLNTAAAAPWTQIGSDGLHPNGTNNGDEHWVIRRYEAEVSGKLTCFFHFRKTNPNGGNGVTGHVFHKGVQVFSRTIAFNDQSLITNAVEILDVQVGDFIDFIIDPTGTDGTANDGSDGSAMTVLIRQEEEPLDPDWNIAATGSRTDGESLVFEESDISGGIDFLQAGTNVLAILGLNEGVSDDDFLIAAEIDASSKTVIPDPGAKRYFGSPSPGDSNGAGVEDLGPVISDVDHAPHQPTDTDVTHVSALVTPTFGPVSSVTLSYRVLFGGEVDIVMRDDGVGSDVVAGDGIYSAGIPAGVGSSGDLLRWKITAADNQGRLSRHPAFEDPINSPEYEGTVIYMAQTNNLPIMHWFIQNASGAENNRDGRFPGSLYFEGEFYDNIGANRHGQSSGGFPTKSFDLDFNPGHNFRWKAGEPRVDDINLMTTYADKLNMRNRLSHGLYRDAGATHHFVRSIRVHRNGGFHGVYDMMENGDDNWLKRIDYDPNGALYKMYNTFTSSQDTTIVPNSEAEKKTRKFEGSADLLELFNGITAPLATKTNYMFDNINIPATVNYLAARVMTSDRDCCHKNYYLYRDTEGNGEWEGMVWDVDLSFGRNWNSANTYWDNNMQFNNGLFVGSNNGFFREIFNYGPTREMYMRRIRTLMEELLQAPDTPPSELHYERLIDEMAEELREDSKLDIEKNGTWVQSSAGPIFNSGHPDYESVDEAVIRIKQEYLAPRRTYMFSGQISGEIPGAQPLSANLVFGAVEFNPSTGDQEQEYIELVNTNDFAMDISGWQLDGAIRHTFIGGTVLPAGFSLFVSPNVNAFRTRAISPKANEGRFLQGDYEGKLSARGETVVLVDTLGNTNRSITYPGNPSLPQQFLRITEIMYHPLDPAPGSPFDAEDFEYMEVKNIGGVDVPLTGVRFVEGVQFTFDGSIPLLGAGQSVVVVKNPAAFVSRYGNSATIAGTYVGFLDNGGERIRLEDSVGEKILDFDYRDGWYPITDGLGFSLVIVDENIIFSDWDEELSWRPSGIYNGSPGEENQAPPVIAEVLVNEALVHTDLPQVDTVEIYNPTGAEVNIGGWFLSDDFVDPKKFRIPDNTLIPSGGYFLLTEADFNPNPGVYPSFSLSSVGDEVFLFSGDGTDLTGYFHGHDFDGSENGVSFGRYVTSIGKDHFVSQVANTLGAANAGPLVGPVVISEIMYHPPDLPGGVDNEADEYIELLNISLSTVVLHDQAFPTNSWELRDGVRFKFPTSASLDPGEFCLVVSFDPTNVVEVVGFRTRNNVPDEVALYGPYRGKLDNSSEDVELFRPDSPNLTEVPFILVDKVDYFDDLPWSSAADGAGPSLNRLDIQDYGNDPTNWVGVAPSPGALPTGGTPPSITEHPQNSLGILGQDFVMSVTATGTGPLSYQWRVNGDAISGANMASLQLSDLQFKDAGVYDVVVFNGAGSAVSDGATLDILVPAAILTQPVSQALNLGSTAVFSVSASSSTPISYQWRKDGIILVGENGTSLTVPNVTEADQGIYTVDVTDAVATITSDPAELRVLILPDFIQPYANRYVAVQGSDVIMSMSTTGTLPMGFRWRKNSSTLRFVTNNVPHDFLVLTNVQPADGGSTRYSVVINNEAFPAPGVLSRSPFIFLTVLTDGDGDKMPDQWETDNGLNPADPSDGPLDADGDGVSNEDEYASCTDPNDPNSYLKIEAVEFDGGVNITFDVKSNKTYSVQYKDSLEIPDWTTLSSLVGRTTNGTAVVTDSNGTPERYYRLVVPAQPVYP